MKTNKNPINKKKEYEELKKIRMLEIRNILSEAASIIKLYQEKLFFLRTRLNQNYPIIKEFFKDKDLLNKKTEARLDDLKSIPKLITEILKNANKNKK